MPNTRNAKKAHRQSIKRRAINRAQRSALKTTVKRAETVFTAGDAEAAETSFRTAVKRLDQAAAKGLIHKNKAARHKSQLARKLAGATKPAAAAE